MKRLLTPALLLLTALLAMSCELVPIDDVTPETDKCKGGCVTPLPTPFCVEYEALDSNGKPLRNFYAFNVASYEEGKQLLAQQKYFQNEAINKGTCGEQSQICPKFWAPVCGQSRDETRTYGNVCEFKVAVRNEAGKTDDSKGHWELGQCKTPYCLEFETADDSGQSLQNFYAFNVGSEAEAKEILGTYGPVVSDALNKGTCADQSKLCPLYFYYAPVCGQTASGEKTYNSLCEFKIAVRDEAGIDDKSKGHYEAGQCEPVSQQIKFETLAKGSYSGYTTPLETAIYHSDKFLNLWKQHTSNMFPPQPAPFVDFGKEMVVAVFMGTMNSGGYGLEITKLEIVGEELRVHYTMTAPGAGCIVTMALTQPHHLIKLALSDKTVVFVPTKTVYDCK